MLQQKCSLDGWIASETPPHTLHLFSISFRGDDNFYYFSNFVVVVFVMLVRFFPSCQNRPFNRKGWIFFPGLLCGFIFTVFVFPTPSLLSTVPLFSLLYPDFSQHSPGLTHTWQPTHTQTHPHTLINAECTHQSSYSGTHGCFKALC